MTTQEPAARSTVQAPRIDRRFFSRVLAGLGVFGGLGFADETVAKKRKKPKKPKKCKSGTKRCGKKCANIATDKANCGGCGKRCAAFEYCQSGECAPCDVCPACVYQTVQAAIDDAQGPADIRICPGRFSEAVTIHRSVTLRGAGDGTGGTIFDAVGRGSAVTVSEGVTANLIGLRLTGGSGTGSLGDRWGGGVYNEGNLTVTGCTIANNGGVVNGGGVYGTVGSWTTLKGVSVSDNQSSFDGGGIGSAGELRLEDCRIVNNKGHGIYSDQSLTAIDTRIEGHKVGSWGAGISSRGALDLTRVTIHGNHSTNGEGGGIAFHGTAVIVDSTVAENIANNGGGIRGFAEAASALTSCTIDGNHANGVGSFATGGGADQLHDRREPRQRRRKLRHGRRRALDRRSRDDDRLPDHRQRLDAPGRRCLGRGRRGDRRLHDPRQ